MVGSVTSFYCLLYINQSGVPGEKIQQIVEINHHVVDRKLLLFFGEHLTPNLRHPCRCIVTMTIRKTYQLFGLSSFWCRTFKREKK